MSSNLQVTVHVIAEDGLPDMPNLTGRVAFIFDGCIVSGWPLTDEGDDDEIETNDDGTPLWEANGDVGRGGVFYDVTHWVEFAAPLQGLTS